MKTVGVGKDESIRIAPSARFRKGFAGLVTAGGHANQVRWRNCPGNERLKGPRLVPVTVWSLG
jgi:hypothetical protein